MMSTTTTKISVCATRMVKGAHAFDVGTREFLDSNGRPLSEYPEEWSLAQALQFEFDTDAHFAAYYMECGAPRLTKSFPYQQFGTEPKCGVIVLDVDLKDLKGARDKVSWASLPANEAEALWAKIRKPVPSLDAQPYCVYSTTNGARIIYLVEPELSPAALEALMARVHKAYLAVGVTPDSACRDWTRLFRLPKVVREGEGPTWESPHFRMEFASEDAIDLFLIPTDAEYAAKPLHTYSNTTASSLDEDCPSDEEAHAAMFDERNKPTDFHKKMKKALDNWHTEGRFLFGGETFDTNRNDGLSRLIGRIIRIPGTTPRDAYIVVNELVKRLGDDEDFRSAAWSMATRFYQKEQAKQQETSSVMPTRYTAPQGTGGNTPTIAQIIASIPTKPLEPPKNDKGNVSRPIDYPHLDSALSMYGAALAFDKFTEDMVLVKPDGSRTVVTDTVIRDVVFPFERTLHVPPSPDAAWVTLFRRQSQAAPFHSVRDMLDALVWDGKPRIEKWIGTYFQIDESDDDIPAELESPRAAYYREVMAAHLIGMVRRVYELERGGSEHQTMVVLEGAQGVGKSSCLKAIALQPEYFTDSVMASDDRKVLVEKTKGKLIVEVAELTNIERTTANHLKSMISAIDDDVRGAYQMVAKKNVRQFILFGTTNDTAYLVDVTGNRRFWPLRLAKVELAAIQRDMAQIWAELVAIYKNNPRAFCGLSREAAKYQEHLTNSRTAIRETGAHILVVNELESAIGGGLESAIGSKSRAARLQKAHLAKYLQSQRLNPNAGPNIMRSLGWSIHGPYYVRKGEGSQATVVFQGNKFAVKRDVEVDKRPSV